MALYNQILPEFQRFNAELLGISVDGVWSHLAFSKDRNLHFPLLSGRIREDLSGVRSGVNGTPTFYINDIRYDGSFDLETLLKTLRSVINRKAHNHRSISHI
jgi:hypothetical protein